MPLFNPSKMTFRQYIEDVYEIKSWGFNWDDTKKCRGLALALPPGWCTRVFRELPSDKKQENCSISCEKKEFVPN